MTRSDVVELRRLADAAAQAVGAARLLGREAELAARAEAGRAHVHAELAALVLEGDLEAARLLERLPAAVG